MNESHDARFRAVRCVERTTTAAVRAERNRPEISRCERDATAVVVRWLVAEPVLVFSSSLFVGWLLNLTSQQQASVSQGRICSGNFTC